MKILVTGAAGFIGFHLTNRLLELNHKVIGLDNLNDYYDVTLKKSRLSILKSNKNFNFYLVDLNEKFKLNEIFDENRFDVVFHFAAQAGVRYSIENPDTYIESNILGSFNILELIRSYPKIHLYYASSSSVYGNSDQVPFSINQRTDNPISLYAATKKAVEVIADAYSSLYDLKLTGFRFFTVYGPWGRPDMAYFSFTKRMLNNDIIEIFNNGDLERDFTYIDDIISPIIDLMNHDINNTNTSNHRLFNLGNNSPTSLMEFLQILEFTLGIKANYKMIEMQKGDVLRTFADIEPLSNLINYKPQTNLKIGLFKFVEWYKNYYSQGV